MKRYNVFRINIDREFLIIVHAALNDALKDFDQTSRVSVESVDVLEEIRDTLGEILDENVGEGEE